MLVFLSFFIFSQKEDLESSFSILWVVKACLRQVVYHIFPQQKIDTPSGAK